MSNNEKQFSAMTTVRNDSLFLPKWIEYYGKAFGYKNLFVFLDGHDQPLPEHPNVDEVNFLRLPHMPLARSRGDRRRARIMSHLARGLFWLFDTILVMDVDEFLVLDPNAGDSLPDYLASKSSRPTLSGLGLDVGQHLEKEEAIDPSQPFLNQRRFAHLSSRYTKPVVANRPVTWGSGMHRVKGRNYHIDENLYLLHFGMVDYERSTGKTADQSRIDAGWGKHLERREELFKIITTSQAHAWDDIIPRARKKQQRARQLFAWNKPKLLRDNPVVEIDTRFKGLI
jgi:hypothetical protein